MCLFVIQILVLLTEQSNGLQLPIPRSASYRFVSFEAIGPYPKCENKWVNSIHSFGAGNLPQPVVVYGRSSPIVGCFVTVSLPIKQELQHSWISQRTRIRTDFLVLGVKPPPQRSHNHRFD